MWKSLFWAAIGLVVVTSVVLALRTANRITLRRDGTLELVRPIGTTLVPVEQVRAIRSSKDEGVVTRIDLVTDLGTYSCDTRPCDVPGIVEALHERNRRIELPTK